MTYKTQRFSKLVNVYIEMSDVNSILAKPGMKTLAMLLLDQY